MISSQYECIVDCLGCSCSGTARTNQIFSSDAVGLLRTILRVRESHRVIVLDAVVRKVIHAIDRKLLT